MNTSTILIPIPVIIIILLLLGIFNEPLLAFSNSQGWTYEPNIINETPIPLYPTITPLPEPLQQAYNITPEPTPIPLSPIPTPSPTPRLLTAFWIRNMSEVFRWERENVSGTKDMIINFTMYRYKFLDSLTVYSISWGRWMELDPGIDQKYLAVWINMEMVGSDGHNDPRMYGMDAGNFGIQYKDKMIFRTLDYEEPWQIKELRLPDYNEVEYTSAWGWRNDQKLYYLRMGTSNAWDGYIIFKVPKSANAAEILFNGNFQGFGSSSWRLTV